MQIQVKHNLYKKEMSMKTGTSTVESGLKAAPMKNTNQVN